MSAIRYLGFEGPVSRSVYAESVRLAELLIKAVSRARRGTQTLALALTIDEDMPPDAVRRSAGWSPWMVLVSDRLRALLRPEDELVQVDRREFVVLLEGTHVESAAAVLRRIHDGVKGVTGAARGLAPRVRVRIGMVPVTGTQTPDDILTSLEASRAHAA